ncbi:MAG: MerR family transcriptional regulator [Novosphingobium sp.]|nr:MerR family transcriptional regulator [Novosphingobium sp.]
MKMRDLEKRTGVNRETIRVYLREGLLPEPVRPARNSANYDERHVRAIKAIRKLQRDTAMTLPQIKDAIAGKHGERPVSARGLTHLEELVSSRVGVKQGTTSLCSLQKSNPHAVEDAKTLDRIGIINLVDSDEGPMISVTDAGLIGIWAQMRERGFTEENGFPPDILSYYAVAAELVAGQEADRFLEQVQGVMDQQAAAEMLEFALPTMLEFFGIIRQRVFLRNIRERTAASRKRKVASKN